MALLSRLDGARPRRLLRYMGVPRRIESATSGQLGTGRSERSRRSLVRAGRQRKRKRKDGASRDRAGGHRFDPKCGATEYPNLLGLPLVCVVAGASIGIGGPSGGVGSGRARLPCDLVGSLRSTLLRSDRVRRRLAGVAGASANKGREGNSAATASNGVCSLWTDGASRRYFRPSAAVRGR